MDSRCLIKVCGMMHGDNIRAVEQLGADFIGLVFCPCSPRFVRATPDYLPIRARRVGVFRNQPADAIRRQAGCLGLDYVQLHGSESPAVCRSLQAAGLRVIKAFQVGGPADIDRAAAYEGCCAYYLFDTPSVLGGGSGRQFDWNLLGCYAGRTPFLLSGGLDETCLDALRALEHPLLAGVDVNSRFETSPGRKDIGRLQCFVQELRGWSGGSSRCLSISLTL